MIPQSERALARGCAWMAGHGEDVQRRKVKRRVSKRLFCEATRPKLPAKTQAQAKSKTQAEALCPCALGGSSLLTLTHARIHCPDVRFPTSFPKDSRGYAYAYG